MLHELTIPPHRNRTLVLLVSAAVLVGAAFVVGINDNLPGIILLLLAAGALLLAFVHPWRSPRQFLWLSGAAVLGFLVSVVLENFFEYGASIAGASLLQSLLGIIGATFFITATIICPAALLIGVVGAVVTALQTNH